MRAGTLAALALLLVGCGNALPAPPEHGLVLVSLEPVIEAEAETVVLPAPAPDGSWVVTLDSRWTRKRGDGPEEEGAARLVLEQTSAPEPDGTSATHLVLRVLDPTGIAEDLVGAMDGLRIVFRRDAEGRPIRPSLRVQGRPPTGALLFFEDLAFAGWGLSPAWWPREGLAVGETWPRTSIDARDAKLDAWSGPDLRRARHGGGRLEAADAETATVGLATLAEVQGELRVPGDARVVGIGVLTEGEAVVDRTTGRARTWRVSMRLRYRDHDGREAGRFDLDQVVAGKAERLREPRRAGTNDEGR